MALSNNQYELIMQEYAKLRARKGEELAERKKAAYEKLPTLSELERELADAFAARTRALILGNEAELSQADAQIKDLNESREILLKSVGVLRSDLELQYECPQCKDTGLVDGKKCACFKRREAELLYDASNIKELLARENFETFNFDFYDASKIDSFSGKTAYENMQEIYTLAKRMAQPFVPGAMNMLITGSAGCGKTFLSNCIAKAALDQGFSVVYFSSQALFDRLATIRFEEHNIEGAAQVLGVDLLIIDDLGTEINNSFVSAQLFTLINERLSKGVSTVISTNLDLNAIRDSYSERVSSRLIGGFECVRMFNQDIRILKSLP